MNSRKCDVCIIDVHRTSYAKHLGSKKNLENEELKNDYTRVVI